MTADSPAARQPPGRQGPSRLVSGCLLAGLLISSATLIGLDLAAAQSSPPDPGEPSPVPAAPIRPDVPAQPGPLRAGPTAESPSLRFDASLDSLVRDGVVTPAERVRIINGSALTPIDVPAHQEACRIGALSTQECSSGVTIRWSSRLRPDKVNPHSLLDNDLRVSAAAPLTVPVSALLAGESGTFRLADVFGVTPRPAPIGGNGNRRMLFPLVGSAVTTSTFGYRLHPLLGNWLMHAGRDLAAPEGTPVVASLSGRVVSSGLAGGYGLAVEVEHDRPRRRTLYGHLSELYVKTGDRVRQGEVIGRVGSTGLSTGPHLHFELRLPSEGGWMAVDPGDLDPGRTGLGGDAVALLMGQLLQLLERPEGAARSS
ncbi:MAG: M23 family metallopeptidase [Cyanobacteriota bacterium]|nr:M23 family metallopeptidase [Cyanobacteriota bacterium]